MHRPSCSLMMYNAQLKVCRSVQSAWHVISAINILFTALHSGKQVCCYSIAPYIQSPSSWLSLVNCKWFYWLADSSWYHQTQHFNSQLTEDLQVVGDPAQSKLCCNLQSCEKCMPYIRVSCVTSKTQHWWNVLFRVSELRWHMQPPPPPPKKKKLNKRNTQSKVPNLKECSTCGASGGTL